MVVNKSKSKTDNMSKKLVDLITNIASKVVDSKTKRIPKEWVAKVVGTSGTIAPNGIASVYLNSDVTSTPISVKNKSWESLVANDEVMLHSPTGSLSNIVILYKK